VKEPKDILSYYREDLERINSELKAFPRSVVSLVEEMGNHVLLAEGKRLRPLLFIMCCRLLEFERSDIFRIATIFEYIHAASLLHDDVIDNSQVRRKRPSANYLWGNHAAVLEGDFLYSKAMTLAVETGSIEFLRVLTKATVDMSEGQILELERSRDWDLTRETYLEIIKGKTASLISAAASSAGIIAGADKETVEAMAAFGLNVGMAFQLIDDLLDYVSREEVFGKPVGKDLKEGKVTLPLIYALMELNKDERDKIKASYSWDDPGQEALEGIISMVRGGRGLKRVRDDASAFLRKASDSLEIFPATKAREDLLQFNEYLLNRTF
jgi:octaprenyl-diphosphate synthase